MNHAAILSILPSLLKVGSGIGQLRAARKAESELVRPELSINRYLIPGQVAEVTGNTKRAALATDLPGQDLVESGIDAKIASLIGSAVTSGGQGGGALSAIAQAAAFGSGAKRDLGVEAANRYDELLGDVNRALMTEAGYKDRKFALDQEAALKEFDYNKDQPFKSKAATISALRGAGNQNIYGAVNDLSTLGAMLALMPQKTI